MLLDFVRYRHLAAILMLLLALPAAAITQRSPEQMLEQTSEQMIDMLKSQRAAVEKRPARLFELVDQVLGPHVDFPLVSQLVLGRNWRTATPEQQARFMEEFRKLLVRFYTNALLEDPAQLGDLLDHSEGLIRFRPTKLSPDSERAIVRSEVHLPSGRVVPVNFNVRNTNGEWMVYDVNVEGVSLVTSYRSDFANEVRRVGLDGLIARLEQRNEQLANPPKPKL